MKVPLIGLLLCAFSSATSASFLGADMRWPGHAIDACWVDPPHFLPEAEAFLDEYRPVVEKAFRDKWGAVAAVQIRWHGAACEQGMLQVRFKTPQFDFLRGGLLPDNGQSRAHIGPKEVGIVDPGLAAGIDVLISRNPYPCNGDSNPELLRQCIYNVAIHELGHALGLIHENARPDTPRSCERIYFPDEYLGRDYRAPTPFDVESVMFSRGPAGHFDPPCQASYLNNGQLTESDVRGVQYAYGYVAHLAKDGSQPRTVILREVQFEGSTYRVELRIEDGRIFLGPVEETNAFTLRPAVAEANVLTIPAIELAGSYYTVELHYIGGNEFKLESAVQLDE